MKLYIKKKRKHLYLELHALTFSYIEVMNFVGSGFLSQVYQASPDWTKPTGPNGATIRFHLKEMNSLKFASNMHVLRVQQSIIAPFNADTDIHLHYIYSVRKRDLLISVIDWILSFQMKVMDNTLYTKLVSVAIAINAVQVWIQLVTLICILLKMALLGLFNKHFMQCGLIKPIQVKHE